VNILLKDTMRLFSDRSLDGYEKVEKEILRILQEKKGIPKKELLEKIKVRGSYGWKEKILRGLVQAGIVENRRGRYYAG